MVIGVPREVKKEEYRVGLTPSGTRELKNDGHIVIVETGAGEDSGFPDAEYLAADAEITDRERLFGRSDLIIKVKEPLPEEYSLLRAEQIVFTYLHLAANPGLTELLLEKNITAMGYETLEKDGALPLLSPMSEVAGRMAPLVGAFFLQKIHGGTGVLCTGVPGVRPATALILGAGVVGQNAARVSIGLGMDTVVMNRGIEKLQYIDSIHMGRVRTLPLTTEGLKEEAKTADIIIGALLVPGGRTPVVITREMLKGMKRGAVIVDVSVDQGGCAETSVPTTHDNPIYIVDGVIHYAVANMPGAYPRTSTLALTNATLPYIRSLAGKGFFQAAREDRSVKTAVNIHRGFVVHKRLADSLGKPYKNLDEMIS